MLPGEYFHVYNRGINRDDIFKEPKNYEYFLRLYSKYIDPVADAEVKTYNPSRQFGHLFNSLLKA